MTFSSAAFLFAFLPLFLGLYFLLPGRRAKNIWLFVGSIFFYAWGEPVYVALMLVSIAANWGFALRIGAAAGTIHKKCLLAAACVFNLLAIGFFKYEGFFADNVNALFGAELVPNLHLPLPIGISFYTLQALSYIIDVYRGEAAPQRNLFHLGMYIACFPQLIAGPIVRYRAIEDQILHRRENLEDFASGLRLFIVGLSKKILLADIVAILAGSMASLGGPAIGMVGAWGGLIAFTFQLYFDFSGYSDMAIGLGRMMGFKYQRNFIYPYASRSIGEFWRRWHISMSSFFRDYLYIPLGGSRVSTLRWLLNVSAVWVLIGLWHGATWNFVLWGVYYCVLLVCEKLVWGRALARLPRPLQHGYTIAAFTLGRLLSWLPGFAELGDIAAALVGVHGLTGTSTFWELQVWGYLPMFVICAVAATPFAPWVRERFAAWLKRRPVAGLWQGGSLDPKNVDAEPLCVPLPRPASGIRKWAYDVAALCCDLALLGLLALCIMAVTSSRFSPFIYFRF